MLLAILRRLVADDAGSAAVEHVLVAAIVSLAGLAALATPGRGVEMPDEAEAGFQPPSC